MNESKKPPIEIYRPPQKKSEGIEDPEYVLNIVKRAQINNDEAPPKDEKPKITILRGAGANSIKNTDVGKPITYGQRKKPQNSSRIERVIAGILIASILFLVGEFAYLMNKVTSKGIEKTAEDKKYDEIVDKSIKKYETALEESGAVVYHEYDPFAHDMPATYHPGILAEQIRSMLESSTNDTLTEIEIREFLLGAHIKAKRNIEYDEILIGAAVRILNNDDDTELPPYLEAKNFEELVRKLGYKDPKEYDENERETIKKMFIKYVEEAIDPSLAARILGPAPKEGAPHGKRM